MKKSIKFLLCAIMLISSYVSAADKSEHVILGRMFRTTYKDYKIIDAQIFIEGKAGVSPYDYVLGCYNNEPNPGDQIPHYFFERVLSGSVYYSRYSLGKKKIDIDVETGEKSLKIVKNTFDAHYQEVKDGVASAIGVDCTAEIRSFIVVKFVLLEDGDIDDSGIHFYYLEIKRDSKGLYIIKPNSDRKYRLHNTVFQIERTTPNESLNDYFSESN
jgi:hypothetical protein